ncbi:UDP-N-acetylglucosamine transferase subunit [Xylographa parallela]|nr:UDP-N-acetylglucosamine transferase subunit [Xylographa parallela]
MPMATLIFHSRLALSLLVLVAVVLLFLPKLLFCICHRHLVLLTPTHISSSSPPSSSPPSYPLHPHPTLTLTPSTPLDPPPPPRHRGTPTRLLIVLGSGGHTAEMLSLLQDLDPSSYTHRSYVVSSGDDFSAAKAIAFEARLAAKCTTATADADVQTTDGMRRTRYGSYDIAFVPRARRIHQPLRTTPADALRCLWACFGVLQRPALPPSPSPSRASRPSPARAYPPRSEPPPPSAAPPLTYPHLILTNGPATATVLVLAALLLRLCPSFLLPFFGLPCTAGTMRCIYVESWARVRRLSLSGRLLVAGGMCDRVLVQWEGLAREGWRGRGWGRREFRGTLVR